MLKKNLIYSAILTLSVYLVPLFVFPYLTRVLGPSGVGAVETVDGIINYAILFSMMGLSTIGAREIAKSKDEPNSRQIVFSSLFTLNVFSTLLVLLIMGVFVCSLPKFREFTDLLGIGMVKILFNMFLVEWLFRGLEKFRYITIRSVIIRLLFILCVFLIVKDKNDYVIYYILWVGMTGCNALANWLYRRGFAHFSIHRMELRTYLRPFVYLGLFAVFSAIYTQLNTFFLGLECGAEQAGYYTVATKLNSVLMALFSSLTIVMIPRMTILFKEQHEMSEIKRLLSSVFQLLFLFAFPVVIYTEVFASDIIFAIGGHAFSLAISPMRLVMPLVFIIGAEQILLMQILVPLHQDRFVFSSALAGAVVCLIVNFFILSHFQCIGSSIAWIAAELTVFALALYKVWNTIHFSFPLRMFLRFGLLSIPYLLGGLLILKLGQSWTIRLCLGAVVFVAYGILVEECVLKIGLMKRFCETFKKNK